MAITITGDQAVTTLGVVHVYQIGGAELERPSKDLNGYPLHPVTWSGDNAFDLRVGEYVKKNYDDTDPSKGYYFEVKQPIDTTKVSMIVDEDLHQGPSDFTIYASCFKKADGINPILPTEALFTGHVGISVPTAKPDRRLKMFEPKVYCVHKRDRPPVISIDNVFASTYPTDDRDIEHRIVFSGDSSFFWDEGQDIRHDSLTPVAETGKFNAILTVHDWAPHADYTGYITVSVIGSVVRHEHATAGNPTPATETVLAQQGYLIFIEYDSGTAIQVRVLQADEEKLIVTKDNKALFTNDADW